MIASSLRNKILLTYGFSKVVMLTFVALVVADLHYVQSHVQSGEEVAAFREAIQEVRREEKNLFLYHDPDSLDQLSRRVGEAVNLLRLGREAISGIADPPTLQRAKQNLSQYRQVLEEYLFALPSDRPALLEALRVHGRVLSDVTEHFGRSERAMVARAVAYSRITLLAAIVVVILLGGLGAWFLVRQVVRPLRELEAQLSVLPDGTARKLLPTSTDREIQSFSRAFNTMIKRLETQQQQLRHHEKAAALGVLVSGVAHELNNPLSNISTSAQLLMEDDGDAELKAQWLANIDGETERARRIVRRLLDSVRQPHLTRQPHNLGDLIESSLKLARSQLPEHFDVKVEVPAGLALVADRERIHQVIINLVRNAADAGASRVVLRGCVTTVAAVEQAQHVHGEVKRLALAPRILELTLEDDGRGIPEADLKRIFEPFFTTRQTGEGTGLGLYLVEEIIAEHQGAIAVQSRPGGGTRFSLWFPLEEKSS